MPSAKESFDQLMNKISLPSGLSIVPNEEMDSFIERKEMSYDGPTGEEPKLLCFKVDKSMSADAAIETIANWIQKVKIVYKTSKVIEDVSLYREFIDTCLDYMLIHKFLILTDTMPSISDKSRELCINHSITFGYLRDNEFGYYDLLTGAGYILKSTKEWGNADDAATYVHWSWNKV